jgi:AraC-like DNA-binding protein
MAITPMSEQAVPVERSEVHVSGDAAEFMLRRSYIDFRQRTSAYEGEFRFDLRRTAADDLVLDHLAYSMAMSITADPLPRMYFFFPTQGRFDFTSQRTESLMQAGDAFLWPVGASIDIDWTPYRAELISIPVEVAERAAAKQGSHAPLRFLGWAPVSAAADRFWRSTAGFVASQLESPEEPLSRPLAYERALDMIGTAAVKAFPNTTMTKEYLPGPGQIAPIRLRRAVEYIEANAALPVTLADIATTVSASPAALEHAFALRYGFGSMEYLRRVRLERAHLELQLANPSADPRVSSIAARWGFLGQRRFSTAYRERYGEAPTETLRS